MESGSNRNRMMKGPVGLMDRARKKEWRRASRSNRNWMMKNFVRLIDREEKCSVCQPDVGTGGKSNLCLIRACKSFGRATDVV